MKLKISCDYCKIEIERYRSQVKGYNFCSRKCLSAFSSKENNPTGYKYRNFEKKFYKIYRDEQSFKPL